MLVLVVEMVSVLVVKGSPYWGWRRFAHFASPQSPLCASQKEVAERDGVGEGGADPAEHWWPPQSGKPGEQPPAGYSEPLLVHLGDGGINLKRRHFHIFYNMKSTMISPHLRKGCFQRL